MSSGAIELFLVVTPTPVVECGVANVAFSGGIGPYVAQVMWQTNRSTIAQSGNETAQWLWLVDVPPSDGITFRVVDTQQDASAEFNTNITTHGGATNCAGQSYTQSSSTSPGSSGTPSSSSTSSSSSSASSSTPATVSGGHSLNAGAIAGGVVGGAVVILGVAAAFWYYYARRRRVAAKHGPSPEEGRLMAGDMSEHQPGGGVFANGSAASAGGTRLPGSAGRQTDTGYAAPAPFWNHSTPPELQAEDHRTNWYLAFNPQGHSSGASAPANSHSSMPAPDGNAQRSGKDLHVLNPDPVGRPTSGMSPAPPYSL